MGYAKLRYEEIRARRFSDVDDKMICLNCVYDEGLKHEVEKHLSGHSCSFCSTGTDDANLPISAPFEEFMYIIMDGIEFLYSTANDANVPWDDGWVVPTVDTWDVVDDVCSGTVDDRVMDAIHEAVHEDDWIAGGSWLESTPAETLAWAWEALSQKVKHSSRFFFVDEPDDTGGHPEELTASGLLQKLENVISDRQAFKKLPPGECFWRGRLVDSPHEAGAAWQHLELGPPPPRFASNNRMSPAGISFFYGSKDIATVIAEIGAHDVRKYAVVGEFECLRALNVVNLVDLPEIPSIFSPETTTEDYYERKFLWQFAIDLSKPVQLDGREHIDYVPTQVVTEYLKQSTSAKFDGILFRSAQNEGVNCVLFVEPSDCTTDRAALPVKYGEAKEATLSFKSRSKRTVRIVASPDAITTSPFA